MIKEHPHRTAFFTVLVPELCCLLLSTSYHLFMAQVKHYDFWLRFDVRFHLLLQQPKNISRMLSVKVNACCLPAGVSHAALHFTS